MTKANRLIVSTYIYTMPTCLRVCLELNYNLAEYSVDEYKFYCSKLATKVNVLIKWTH